jgi:hypothetical protein
VNDSVERIVVALDAASENRAAIGTATRLAARLKARLHGVFVEDDDLIRLANLPFACQVTLGVGVEKLNLQQTRRQLHAFAERARHDLAASAKRHGVDWSFEIVHGTAAAGGVAAATDLFVACTSTRPIGNYFRVECRWWSIDEPAPATFLLAHRDWHPHGAVAALLHGSGASAERLLATAIRLAEANDARLIVLHSSELAEAPGFAAWLDERLAGHAAEVHPAPARRLALHRRIAELECRLVAIEADATDPNHLRDMVTQLACDVLVVR